MSANSVLPKPGAGPESAAEDQARGAELRPSGRTQAKAQQTHAVQDGGLNVGKRDASAASPRAGKNGAASTAGAVSSLAERRLMQRVYDRCHAAIASACGDSKFRIQDPKAISNLKFQISKETEKPISDLKFQTSERTEEPMSNLKFEISNPGNSLPHESHTLPPESHRVPREFLGALTANETGGNANAARFEPAVYRHLLAVAQGKSPAYGGIKPDRLMESLGRIIHPKAEAFHAEYLTPWFASQHVGSLSSLEDERLRELATSWGFTQIMGYHVLCRTSPLTRPMRMESANSKFKIQNAKAGISNLKFEISKPEKPAPGAGATISNLKFEISKPEKPAPSAGATISNLKFAISTLDAGSAAGNSQASGLEPLTPSPEPRNMADPKILLDPVMHFKIALELLEDFCVHFALEPDKDFAELLRCWNTGQPYRDTYDPQYVESGLRRMEIYRRLANGEL